MRRVRPVPRLRPSLTLAAAAALVLACGGRRDDQARPDSTTSAPASPEAHVPPPESIAPAPDSSFAWFAGRALTELRDSVTLAMWLASHRNDTLPRDNGPWCAQAVATMDIEEDRIAIRRAYFYAPIPPADSKRMPANRPDIARECRLGRIVVRMAAGRSESSLLESTTLEMRRLFDRPQRPRAYQYGAERARDLDDRGQLMPGDSLEAWGKLPIADSTDHLEVQSLPDPAANDTTFVRPFQLLNQGCDNDLDSLIRTGEQRLADGVDNQLAMVIHYMVADALADQLHESRADTATVTRAINHYRAALALEPAQPSGYSLRARWILWRLLAGMRPWFFTYGGKCGD